MRGENVQGVVGREGSAWSSNEDCEDENGNAGRVHQVITSDRICGDCCIEMVPHWVLQSSGRLDVSNPHIQSNGSIKPQSG